MNSFSKYISGIYTGVKSLLGGMQVTWKELWTKKVTMQYPENRETLKISDRWRAVLIMPHDENNEHFCTACGICQTNCPNGTIQVISKMVETEEGGRPKKALDKHIWDNGMCTFCNLCVITCPSDAIIFTNEFENAVFDKSKFVHQLNKEGSRLKEKKKEAAPKTVETETKSAKSE
ncbi:MAG: 4Fe-4S binding protein [Paludibacteraceae bacterium]